MSDLTPEALDALAALLARLPEGPFEVYENLHAEAAVAEAGRGGFGVVALPATGREDYGRAYIVAITALLNAAPALIAAARERDRLGDALNDAEQAKADLRSEVAQLERWKAEALVVMDGLQEIGGALGLPLGERVTGRAAVDAALDLRNRADQAEAKVAAVLAECDYAEDGRGSFVHASRLRSLADPSSATP